MSLLINCIVTWNTHYINEAIKQLRQEGQTVDNDSIQHLSPLMHTHINPYGTYDFNVEETGENDELTEERERY